MLLDEIKTKIYRIVSENGAELVENSINFVGGSLNVKLLVDFSEGGIDISTCSRINREISNWLDSIPETVADYFVEVSSPGLDRKLKTYNDFVKVKGHVVEVLLLEKVSQKGQWRGRLEEVTKEGITLQVHQRGKYISCVSIPYDKIQQGRVILYE